VFTLFKVFTAFTLFEAFKGVQSVHAVQAIRPVRVNIREHMTKKGASVRKMTIFAPFPMGNISNAPAPRNTRFSVLFLNKWGKSGELWVYKNTQSIDI